MLFTFLENVTSKYPNTGFLIYASRALWIYCTIYGFIAVAGFFLSGWLISTGKLKIEGLGLDSPCIRGLVIGLTTKAIMQINIYTVTTGSTSFPIGFQTFVQLFEPYLIRFIGLDEFELVRKFVAPFVARFNDLDQVKSLIKQNIPVFIPAEEKGAFENEIDKETSVRNAMERFLRFLGRKTFERVFSA